MLCVLCHNKKKMKQKRCGPQWLVLHEAPPSRRTPSAASQPDSETKQLSRCPVKQVIISLWYWLFIFSYNSFTVSDNYSVSITLLNLMRRGKLCLTRQHIISFLPLYHLIALNYCITSQTLTCHLPLAEWCEVTCLLSGQLAVLLNKLLGPLPALHVILPTVQAGGGAPVWISSHLPNNEIFRQGLCFLILCSQDV